MPNEPYTFDQLMDYSIEELKEIRQEFREEMHKKIQKKYDLAAQILFYQEELNKQ